MPFLVAGVLMLGLGAAVLSNVKQPASAASAPRRATGGQGERGVGGGYGNTGGETTGQRTGFFDAIQTVFMPPPGVGSAAAVLPISTIPLTGGSMNTGPLPYTANTVPANNAGSYVDPYENQPAVGSPDSPYIYSTVTGQAIPR